jgi:SagB-type dehydrogenase family enzyme
MMRCTGMQLGDPIPLDNPAPGHEFAFVTEGSPEYLTVPAPSSPDFFSVLSRRLTRRSFSCLSEESLSTLLWYTAKTLASASNGYSKDWEHRVPPSAGGCHPIDLVIAKWPCADAPIRLYDPIAHATRMLTLKKPPAFQYLLDRTEKAVPHGKAVVFWHLAQIQRTFGKYSNAESLIWRDAGALVAITCLVAEALGLACCPLGMTGEPWLSEGLGSGNYAIGVGGCIVGGR